MLTEITFNEAGIMFSVRMYELANAKIRDEMDLSIIDDIIVDAVAGVYPEATNVRVFKSFYCFRLPVSVDGKYRRAPYLGIILARETREFTQRAMRSYESEGHSRSNQLFKKVLGKKRQAYCEAELLKVGY